MILTPIYEKSCPITSVKAFSDYFRKGIKNEKLTGLEYEHLTVYRDNLKPVIYEDVCKILTEFVNANAGRSLVKECENIVGAICEYGHLSLEPGSQIELSIVPRKNISEIKTIIDKYISEITEIENKFGIKNLHLGIRPDGTPDDITIIPKRRYKLMTEYFKGKDTRPYVMMRHTAGIQTSVDYSSEEDACRKLKAAIKLSPFVSALYSNSKRKDFEITGLKSARAEAWLHTDNDRCGLIGKELFEKNDFCFDDYSKILAKVPVIFIVRNGKYIPTGDLTFENFIKNGYEGFYPEFCDLENHISLYFTDVRLKTYLEIRNHDSQKPELICTVPALWKGLMYDENSLCAVEELFKGAKYEDFEEFRQIAPKTALSGEFCGRKTSDIVKEIYDISRTALEKTDETEFLKPLERFVLTGKTPADFYE